MAQGIQKRISKNGIISYRVQIPAKRWFSSKIKNIPNSSRSKDWQTQEKARRRQGAYFPEQENAKHTLAELIDRYIAIILPTKPKDARNAQRQLEWWKSKLVNMPFKPFLLT